MQRLILHTACWHEVKGLNKNKIFKVAVNLYGATAYPHTVEVLYIKQYKH